MHSTGTCSYGCTGGVHIPRKSCREVDHARSTHEAIPLALEEPALPAAHESDCAPASTCAPSSTTSTKLEPFWAVDRDQGLSHGPGHEGSEGGRDALSRETDSLSPEELSSRESLFSHGQARANNQAGR